MKRVLVTAINSQSDQQLVAYLLSQNFIVRILAESIDAGNPLLRLPVEIYPGNLSDAVTVALSARGCDYIIQTQPACPGKNSIKECIIGLHETMNVMEAAFVAKLLIGVRDCKTIYILPKTKKYCWRRIGIQAAGLLI